MAVQGNGKAGQIMSFDPEKPFNDLPLLPPKVELETPSILKRAISANRALAELKGLVNVIPNQDILINTLILNEAKDSSEIENIITTRDELYQAFSAANKKIDPATKEVLRYREALWSGYTHLKKKSLLTLNTILSIHAILVGNDAGIRKQPGTKLQNDITGEIIYTPPEHVDILRTKLQNLFEYLHSEKEVVDPLIRMAVLHYQFKQFIPFMMGTDVLGEYSMTFI
jgi:Fic family protein